MSSVEKPGIEYEYRKEPEYENEYENDGKRNESSYNLDCGAV